MMSIKIVRLCLSLACLVSVLTVAGARPASASPSVIDRVVANYDSCSGILSFDIAQSQWVQSSWDYWMVYTWDDVDFSSFYVTGYNETYVYDPSTNSGTYHVEFVSPLSVEENQTLYIAAYDYGNVVEFSLQITTVGGGNCLGSVRGTTYKDGAIFGGAWYKITDGGNWFVCGTVGSDGTFGVPLKAGEYYVIPLNLKGLRATTEITKAVVRGGTATLGKDIKYVTDPTATLDSCDLYNPPRPIPASAR
jgi:hypothetical protein